MHETYMLYMIHCQCGICGHSSDKDCLRKECECCMNFHLRSGPKLKTVSNSH